MAKRQIKSIGEKAKQSTVKRWVTEILATPYDSADPATLVKWRGPIVPGETMDAAQVYCLENGFGFCKVIGEKI